MAASSSRGVKKPDRPKSGRRELVPASGRRTKVGTVKLDDIRHPIRTAKAAVRREASDGAREAVMPWVMLSVALSLYAISKR